MQFLFKFKSSIENHIDTVFEPIYSTIISNIQKSPGKSSGWIIDSVIGHTISISKYPLARSTYIKLPNELDHPRKGLINIQNTGNNECFKWSTIRYVNPANHLPVRITKADKEFAKRLEFKDTKFPGKIKGIQKIEKKNSIGGNDFGCENKEKKWFEEKHVDLSLIGEEGKRRYVLIKDFNTFMYDHTYIVEKNIFVNIVYKLLVQKKY